MVTELRGLEYEERLSKLVLTALEKKKEKGRLATNIQDKKRF